MDGDQVRELLEDGAAQLAPRGSQPLHHKLSSAWEEAAAARWK